MAKASRDIRPSGETEGPAVEQLDAVPATSGADAVRTSLATMPEGPGVYRMLSSEGEVLYVGKARNLAHRVAAYAQPGRLDPRLHRMVAGTAAVEVVTTATEAEARFSKPISSRSSSRATTSSCGDDNSFPYILLRREPPVAAESSKHRGARRPRGDYFGPFRQRRCGQSDHHGPAEGLFSPELLRSLLNNRTRPLPAIPDQTVRGALRRTGRRRGLRTPDGRRRAFLKGQTREVQDGLSRRMQEAARSP